MLPTRHLSVAQDGDIAVARDIRCRKAWRQAQILTWIARYSGYETPPVGSEAARRWQVEASYRYEEGTLEDIYEAEERQRNYNSHPTLYPKKLVDETDSEVANDLVHTPWVEWLPRVVIRRRPTRTESADLSKALTALEGKGLVNTRGTRGEGGQRRRDAVQLTGRGARVAVILLEREAGDVRRREILVHADNPTPREREVTCEFLKPHHHADGSRHRWYRKGERVALEMSTAKHFQAIGVVAILG